MLPYAIIVVFLILLWTIKWIKGAWKVHDGRPIPRHPGLPLIGSALELNDRNSNKKFEEMTARYGEIFSLNMFGQNVVVLSSENMIRKAFCSEQYAKHLNNKPRSFFGTYFRNNCESLAFFANATDPLYKRLKKVFMAALHSYGSGLQNIENKVVEELENVREKIDSFKGKEFGFDVIIKQSLTNIMSLVLIGEAFPDDEPEENLFWQKIAAITFFITPHTDSLLSLFPFLRFIPGLKFQKAFRFGKNVDKIIAERFFYSTRNKPSIRHNKGIVDYYLAEQTKQKLSGNEPFLTDERIKTQLYETIDAGIVTSWSLLVNSMVVLLNHPEIQTKVQEELDRVVGGNRSPTFSDRSNCHYFMAFEKEVHRLITVAPRLVPHYCYDDIVFEGYFVPKGSMIVPNIWSVHHDEKLWGDPWIARPERFLDEDGFLLPSEHIYCRSLMPFGLGDRRCSGETFAKTRYFLFLSTLLQRYTFKFAEGSIKRSCDPRNVDDFEVDIVFRAKSFSVQAVERV
ncbi:Cytochrome P450 2D6 [Mactra antiquata]